MRKAFRERRVFHHVRSDSLMIVHLVDRSRADKASVDGGATGSGFGGNKSEAAAPVRALRPAEPREVVPGYGHFGGSPIPMRRFGAAIHQMQVLVVQHFCVYSATIILDFPANRSPRAPRNSKPHCNAT